MHPPLPFRARRLALRLPAALGALSAVVAACGGESPIAAVGPAPRVGNQIVFTSGVAGPYDIYVMHVDGSGARSVTTQPQGNQHGDYTPDGFGVAFMSNRTGSFQIYTIGINGRGLMQLTTGGGANGFPRWSPDGSRVLFTSDRKSVV